MNEHTNLLIDTWTVQHQLAGMIFPVCLSLVMCLINFTVCKWVCRDEEKTHNQKLALPVNYDSLSIDEKIQVVLAQRRVAGKGSPAEKLFLKTLPLTVILILVIGFFTY